jgi:hypothetical protein
MFSPVPSKPKTMQSVVTAGCGYLYVYGIIFSFFECKDNKISAQNKLFVYVLRKEMLNIESFA